MDWTGCDLVEVIPGKVSGQPLVKNSQVQADTVVQSYKLGQSIEEIADDFNLDLQDVRHILVFAGFQSINAFRREAMDWTGCGLVEIDRYRSMGQPVVKGTRIRAATIVESWELGEDIEDIAHTYHLDYYDVRNILIFAGAHSDLERSAPTDWTGCDEVEVIPGKVSGKPILKDSRVMADQIVDSYELGESVRRIAYTFSLSSKQVRKVLDFAGFLEVLKKSA